MYHGDSKFATEPTVDYRAQNFTVFLFLFSISLETIFKKTNLFIYSVSLEQYRNSKQTSVLNDINVLINSAEVVIKNPYL